MAEAQQQNTEHPSQTLLDVSALTWLDDLDQLTFSQYILYLCQACTNARDMPIHITPSQAQAWHYTVCYKAASKTYNVCCCIKELPKVVEQAVKRIKKREDEDEEDYFIQRILRKLNKVPNAS